MAEKSINKVIYNGDTLIDLTGDTITPDQLQKGITAHDKSGATIVGTDTRDVDSKDANVNVAEILMGKTAYARGAKVTGTMPNNAAVSLNISAVSQEVTVPQGYHDGSGKVFISVADQEKLIAANIREGISVLGVEGAMSGSEDMKPQAVTVTPSSTEQSVVPAEGYNCISQVTVSAIPYAEAENSAGGTTVTIGG